MRRFTAAEALKIAAKLGCTPVAGGKHEVVRVVVDGRLVAHFGIRRGSGDQGHEFIPKQLYLKRKSCWELHDCTMSREQYIAELRGKGLLGPAGKGNG